MCPIVDEPCYVVFRHFGELFLEDAFQASEDDAAFAATVVVDDSELDLVLALFDHGGLGRACQLVLFKNSSGEWHRTFSGKGTMRNGCLSLPLLGSGLTVPEVLMRLVGLSLPFGPSALRFAATASVVSDVGHDRIVADCSRS